MIMIIPVSQLPSQGHGYSFTSVTVNPMTFLEITRFLENAPDPSQKLEKYLYDINSLMIGVSSEERNNIKKCYLMDLDFLVFYKKLITISDDLEYNVTIECPNCGKSITRRVSYSSDVHFRQADPEVMGGATVELGGHKYELIIPTFEDFTKVYRQFLRRSDKIDDMKMIKLMALFKDFDLQGAQIEKDILGATHSDITLLTALSELYYNHLENIQVNCPHCNNEGRGSIEVSAVPLISDFFREIIVNCPIDGNKILFKQNDKD